MSLTHHWTPGAVLKGPHLLYDSIDEDGLCTALEVNNVNPLTYKLKPNGIRFAAVIWAFLCYQDDASRSWFLREAEVQDAPVYHLIRETQNLVLGLADITAESILFSADRILDSKVALPDDFRWVVEFIRDMALELFPVLAYGSAYSFSHIADHNRAWWRYPPRLGTSVADFQRRFSRIWHKGVPTQITPIANWLGGLRNRLLGFHSPSTTAPVSRADAAREASAYCGAMAERQLLMGHKALALVTLHRAADLLFFSLCIDNSLIDFTANFTAGGYASGAGATNSEVSLKTSVKLIDSYLSPDSSRSLAFDELNKWRNQLIYAHYLSDVDDNEVRRLFALCRPHLERLGGRQWTGARDSLLRGPKVDAADLLNVNGCLSTLFEHVRLSP